MQLHEASYQRSLFQLWSVRGIYNLLYFILILRCCLVAIKEAFFIFLLSLLVSLPLRVRVRVSNAFYASLRLLKAGNSGGLPSLSLLVFRYFYVRESPVWTLFGAFLAIYWSC